MDAFSPNDLKLALGYDLAYRLLARDGAVDPDESVFFDRAFPHGEMVARGFVQGRSLTPRYHEAVKQGRAALANLSVDDRLDLAETLWRAAEVDGRLDAAEVAWLDRALDELGLTRKQLDERLGLSSSA